ncbi:hypothetical protein PHMEG_00036703 [Phytophthora megakarya]|uniref:Retrotransposon gag domain-containing protein n=1 Tax=Phytophthora megakarya TaxID=4795 RepID=A0A225UL82_9STRA|nr:hypothetical protein PHMEG_00036703 [Phytophthora megakarya]
MNQVESTDVAGEDFELPTFTPSPKVSVSTWIDRVDLALKGAAEFGGGEWSDKNLKRTWTYLKKALLRHYGEKLDKNTAEWRVSMRRMMPEETHADFAAGLRDMVGWNRVSERVLLAQFYRNLDKMTKTLVKQHSKPRTLEEAVE